MIVGSPHKKQNKIQNQTPHTTTYLMGAPEEQDGLSPNIRSNSRIYTS